MDAFEEIKDMLPWLIPVFILSLSLMIIALVDLVKREKVRGNSKVVWVLIIIFINLIGPIVYLVAGRSEESEEVED